MDSYSRQRLRQNASIPSRLLFPLAYGQNSRRLYPQLETPEQYQSVAPYLLEKLVDDHFCHRSKHSRETPGGSETRPQKKANRSKFIDKILSVSGDVAQSEGKSNPE